MNTFISKINEVRDILRKDGITGMESITHCVAFYVLRNLSNELCIKLVINDKYSYDKFNKDNDGITVLCKDKLFEKFYKKGEECFVSILVNKFKFNPIKQFAIKTSLYLERIFKCFESINPEQLNINYDIVGAIYEIHLATGATGQGMRDLGQYFTHRKVIKYMVELCNPKVKPNGLIETILDPAMGTGGFLTMATKHLNTHNTNINWSQNQSNIYGFDISDNVQSLAYINLLLENNEIFENIKIQDTLHGDYKVNDTIIDKYDVILANEPFGLRNIVHAECCKRIVDLKIRGTKAEPLFLQLMMISLNQNGRCAVIVPDGVLFNDAKLHKDTRKYLIENLNLEKIIGMEDDTFMNTGVKSSILYFVNNGTTTNVKFCKIKLVNNEIVEEIIKTVSKDIIVSKDYSLFINKYIQSNIVQLSNVEYKKIGDICNIMNGYAFKSVDYINNGNIKLITIKNIDKIINLNNCETLIKNDRYTKYIIKKNDILMSLTGNIKIGIYDSNEDAYLNQRVIKFENFNGIIDKYLYYYIQYYCISNIQKNTKGSVQGNISSEEIKEIQIPIPPLEIQNQIITVLDNDYLIIKNSNELIKMYEEKKKGIVWSNTINTRMEKLSNICSFKSGKFNASDAKTIGLYPFYSSEANNPVGLTDNFCFDYENYLILIKDGGAGQGKYGNQIGLGKVFKINGKSSATSHQIAIIPNESNIYLYLYFYIQYIKNNIMDLANYTTGLGTIRKSLIEDIEIPIPSLEVQQDIVNQCEHYDNLINTLKKQIENIEKENTIVKVLQSLNTV